MLRIQQLKLDIDHKEADIVKKIGKMIKADPAKIKHYQIVKQSIDARDKDRIFYSYTIDVEIENENKILQHVTGNAITLTKQQEYSFPDGGNVVAKERPVIIGAGPAGLFCAYMLAKHGYKPILLERGADVEERILDVNRFWETGVLHTDSNIQFGEGGAGTFSDGKLNTLNKDPKGRNKLVLEIFAECGAPKEILYLNKPHLGTDNLIAIVKNMRQRIIEWGGEVRFHSKVTSLIINNAKIKGLMINETEQIDSEIVVLAIGHSARDTFSMLYESKIPMEAKAFAVGLRVEHLQDLINVRQYGEKFADKLPPADYKLTAQTSAKRGVYTFCMCPGGYVVNASSEKGRLVTNGMSYHDRSSRNANSAVIVTVTPDDFTIKNPLGGVVYQRELEEKAFQAANGKIPIQLLEDFQNNKVSSGFGRITPCMKGNYEFANVAEILPPYLRQAFIEGMQQFDKKIHGFGAPDTILSGVESRTSSPVRIIRNENFESMISGLYPCGEGAGYAGGITSAAMDGVKVAEAIAEKYKK